MIYTVVREYRYGSFLGKWLCDTKSYDSFRGVFGYGGSPVTYYTGTNNPFCLVFYQHEKQPVMFDTFEYRVINPILEQILRDTSD